MGAATTTQQRYGSMISSIGIGHALAVNSLNEWRRQPRKISKHEYLLLNGWLQLPLVGVVANVHGKIYSTVRFTYFYVKALDHRCWLAKAIE